MTVQNRRRSRRKQRPLYVYGLTLIAVAAAALAIFFHGGGAPGTYASNFQAQNTYPTTQFTAASLTAPTGLSVTPKGNSVTLTWTAATTVLRTKQLVAVADQKATTTCTSTSPTGGKYTTLSTLSTTATTYTDANRSTTGTYKAGDWLCYRVGSGYLTSWSSSDYQNLQAGLVASSLALTGATGVITNTAEVILTFNQPVTGIPSTAGKATCVIHSTTYLVVIGVTAAAKATCTSATIKTSYMFGSLKSASSLTHTNELYPTLTATLSATHRILTLKLSGNTTASKISFTTSRKWTFTPAATLAHYLTTASIKVCTTNIHKVTLCEPHVTTKKF